MNSGILYTDLSDHFPIFLITQFKLITNPSTRKKQIRLINSSNINKFQSKLAETDWSFLCNINSVNDCYNAFSRYLIPIYNQSFPIKTVDFKLPHFSKPWFSHGLQTSCKRKNSLYKQFVINPTPLNKSKYNKFRNKYNYLVKLARKKYFHEKLISVTSDLKKTWSVIKQVISKKKTEPLYYERRL